MVKQFLFGILLGALATLFFAQYDSLVFKKVEQLFGKALKGSSDCTVFCKVKKLNFFAPRFEFEEVRVVDKNHKWEWQCDQYVLESSWLNFLLYGVLDLGVALTDLKIKTAYQQNSLTIMPHIEELVEAAHFPIRTALKSVLISKCSCDVDGDTLASFRCSGEIKRINNQFKSAFYLHKGSFNPSEKLQLSNGEGTINIAQSAEGTISAKVDCRAQIPQLEQEGMCFIAGSWNHDHGRFSLRNISQTLSIDPVVITKKNNQWYVQTAATIPGKYLSHMIPVCVQDEKGSCFLRVAGTLDHPSTIDGYVSLEDVTTCFQNINGKVTFYRRANQWYGAIDVRLPNHINMTGDWKWDEALRDGYIDVSNRSLISLPLFSSWKVDPQQLQFHASIDQKNGVDATYECTMSNKFALETSKSKGTLSIGDDSVRFQGNIKDHHISGSAQFHKAPFIRDLTCKDADGNNIFEVIRQGDQFDTNIHISFLRSCLHLLGYDLQGEGILNIASNVDGDTLASEISLKNGTIRVPQTYNFLNELQAKVICDFSKREVVVENAQAVLHGGSVTTNRAVFTIPDLQNITAYLPITFNRCMLNMKQDLFAMISGYLLFEKRLHELPLLKGSIILDRSQLKENIFSQELQKTLLNCTGQMFEQSNYQLLCDIRVQTKDPIRVDTELLQASAKAQFVMRGNILFPKVEGAINLLSGAIHFPYKSLSISKGAISFDPNQPYDPLIELLAKTKIKKHEVVLHVTGSLYNHYITLESSPPLSEEQLVSLLLVGSPEQSLNTMMPALIAQNLRNVIFGTNHAGGWDYYYKQWAKPFNIHLIPSFTDQTGRGGLRGALEIDINERWRALIQKNFNLTEDTRFELEYFVSDDVSLRAIRDERKDIATEVEMRWKF